MKKISLLIFALTFAHNVLSQSLNDYEESVLQKGYPLVTEMFFDWYGQYQQNEVKTAVLRTGIDSLQVYFGMADKNDGTGRKFYWSAIANGDSLLTLLSGFLLPKDSTGLLSGTVELILGQNSPQKVVYLAKFDPDKNIIRYQWVDERSTKKANATIITNENLKAGNSFANMNFNLLKGNQLSSKDLKGKIIVINWWNTGCTACVAEMPGLNSLVDEYSKNRNVVFIAVAHNTKDEVVNFLKKRNFKYRHGVHDKTLLDYFGIGYPIHLIVDKNGKIAYYVNGGGSEVHHQIKKALDKVIME